MAENHDLVPLRVVRSQPLARPDGRIAIGLWFQNGNAIAIELDAHILGVLKKQIANLEAHLGKPTGRA